MKKAPYIEVTAPCGNQSFEEASSESQKTPQASQPSLSPDKRNRNEEMGFSEMQAEMAFNTAAQHAAFE